MTGKTLGWLLYNPSYKINLAVTTHWYSVKYFIWVFNGKYDKRICKIQQCKTNSKMKIKHI